MTYNNNMTSKNVIDLYTTLDASGVKIWIEGGWGVDALLGEETRPHSDVDIALEWKDVPKLRKALERKGYSQVREDSKWNFVLANKAGQEVDVHAFVYDEKGEVVEGVMYP